MITKQVLKDLADLRDQTLIQEQKKKVIEDHLSTLHSSRWEKEEELTTALAKFKVKEAFRYKGYIRLEITSVDIKYDLNNVSFSYHLESEIDRFSMEEAVMEEKIASGEWESFTKGFKLPKSLQLETISVRKPKEGRDDIILAGVSKKHRRGILFSCTYWGGIDPSREYVIKYRARCGYYIFNAKKEDPTEEKHRYRRRRRYWNSNRITILKIYPKVEDMLGDLV